MRARSVDLARRKGDYGFDAPYVPLLLGGGALLLLLAGVVNIRLGSPLWAAVTLAGGALLLLSTASYVYTTRVGKFMVWSRLLRDLRLRGDERVLDLGCGRGAVLLMAAQLVPRGGVVGVDLWKAADQSGNRMEVTLLNAEFEGVRERVDLRTGDMRSLPFPDGSFDVVLSSLAIHNLPDAGARREAVDEAVRVLKPGGRLLIADIRSGDEYVRRLRQLGLREAERRDLGWRFWYGGPWMATSLVAASKPAVTRPVPRLPV